MRIHFHLLVDTIPGALVAEFDVARPAGAKEAVPEGEERLGEVVLDSPALMVDIVVSGVVPSQLLEGVPRESVAAVVIDRLDSGEGEVQHGLSGAHHSGEIPNPGASSVEEESLDWVIVQSTKRIWYIESMMTRMEIDCISQK